MNPGAFASALTDLNINSEESVQLITSLLTSKYDISACLTNCSGNGECAFSGTKFICNCFYNYFTGTKCERDKRLCSSFQCFNNGTCNDKINETINKYDFECDCQYPYYGKRCTSRLNLCLNSTCISNQGMCFINGSQIMCKCYTGYSGNNCEIISTGVKVIKAVSTGSAVVAILILVSFFIFIISMDVSKLFTTGVINKKKVHPKKLKPKNDPKLKSIKKEKTVPNIEDSNLIQDLEQQSEADLKEHSQDQIEEKQLDNNEQLNWSVPAFQSELIFESKSDTIIH